MLRAWTAGAVARSGSAWRAARSGSVRVVWVAEFDEGVGELRRPFSSSFSSSWMSLSGRARGIKEVAGGFGTWRRKRRKG